MQKQKEEYTITAISLIKKKGLVLSGNSQPLWPWKPIRLVGKANTKGNLVVDNVVLKEECSGEFLRDKLIPILKTSTGYAQFMIVWDNGLNGIEEMEVLNGTITWKPYL